MKKLLVFLLATLVLVACAPDPDDELSADWCYTFPFNEADQGFSLSAGAWRPGEGFITDDSGLLMFAYGHDRFVAPKYVVITVARPWNIEGIDSETVISATTQGEIFGLSGGFTGTLGAGQNSAVVTLSPPEIGIAGTAINVTVETDQYIVIRSIEVRGDGSNPFDRNECDYDNPYNPTATSTPEGTPTATQTFTATYTSTATVTGTYTPSPTPTYSPTPLETWECIWDFSISDGGWAVREEPNPANASEAGQYDAIGGYWESSVALDTYDTISISIATTYSYAGSLNVAVDYEYLVALPQNLVQWRDAPYDAPTTGGQANYGAVGAGSGTWSVSSGDIEDVDYVRIFVGSDLGSGPENSRIHRIAISGAGAMSPFATGAGITCDTPTPTPSPTPSITPTPNMTETSDALATATAASSITPTGTPSDRFVCTYNFIDNAGGFTAVDLGDGFGARAIYNEGAGWQGLVFGSDLNTWIEKNISSTLITGITLNWTVTIPSATLSIDAPYNDSITVDAGGRVHLYTGQRTGVSYLLFTGMGANATGKQLTLTRAEIRGEGTRPSGASCQEPTATPSMSRTPLATTTQRPPTRTPVKVTPIQPPPTLDLTSIPLSVTPWILTGTAAALTSTAQGTPGGTGTPAQTGTPSDIGIGSGSEAGGGLNGIWQIGQAFGNLITGWMGQASGAINGLFGSFTNAQPTPIPGLPLCMSNPMAHDICAIYWILDNTLLAPGTPGSLIIPMIQIMMNVYIVIYFVRWVLRIIRRGETVTNVT